MERFACVVEHNEPRLGRREPRDGSITVRERGLGASMKTRLRATDGYILPCSVERCLMQDRNWISHSCLASTHAPPRHKKATCPPFSSATLPTQFIAAGTGSMPTTKPRRESCHHTHYPDLDMRVAPAASDEALQPNMQFSCTDGSRGGSDLAHGG